MSANLEKMSRTELVQELRRLQADLQSRDSVLETARLVRDLQDHQIELEMQNQALRETQHLLEESRSWYAELFDQAPVGYCTLDAAGRIKAANLAAGELFRMDRAQLVGRLLGAMVSVGHEQTWREHMQTCLEDRSRAAHEVAFSIRGRGSVITRVVSVPTLRSDAAVGGCRTTLTDISASKESENMLRFMAEASAALSSSLEYGATLTALVRLAVPVFADICCIDVVDSDGTEGNFQRIAVAFADKAQDELAARLKSSVPDRHGETPPAHVLRTARPLLFAHADQSPIAVSDAVRACNPTSLIYVPLIARERTFGVLTLVMAQSGRHYSQKELGLASEIARRAAMAIDNAQLYEKAREASKSRDDILEMVSHDLKSPLNGIMMAMQLTQSDRTGGSEQRARVVQQVVRTGKQMTRMLDDLVDVSSIEAGRLAFDRLDHGLDELIEEALGLFRTDAEHNGQDLRAEATSVQPRVYCDRMRVLQVLANLIHNAIKFVPSGGSITVATELRANEACVSIRDTGPGIPSARLEHLFERYYQADETAPLGRGLGLYISRRLIEAQQGRIWADSVLGAGSTFHFTLPLSSSRLPAA